MVTAWSQVHMIAPYSGTLFWVVTGSIVCQDSSWKKKEEFVLWIVFYRFSPKGINCPILLNCAYLAGAHVHGISCLSVKREAPERKAKIAWNGHGAWGIGLYPHEETHSPCKVAA